MMTDFPCPNGWGYFVVSFIYLPIPVLQIKYSQKAARISKRKAAESAKSISDMKTQTVIV